MVKQRDPLQYAYMQKVCELKRLCESFYNRCDASHDFYPALREATEMLNIVQKPVDVNDLVVVDVVDDLVADLAGIQLQLHSVMCMYQKKGDIHSLRATLQSAHFDVDVLDFFRRCKIIERTCRLYVCKEHTL